MCPDLCVYVSLLGIEKFCSPSNFNLTLIDNIFKKSCTAVTPRKANFWVVNYRKFWLTLSKCT